MNRSYHVITDAGGAVVAHGPGPDPADKGPKARLRPLAGQTLHLLELPEEHASRSAEELHELIVEGEWPEHVRSRKPGAD